MRVSSRRAVVDAGDGGFSVVSRVSIVGDDFVELVFLSAESIHKPGDNIAHLGKVLLEGR